MEICTAPKQCTREGRWLSALTATALAIGVLLRTYLVREQIIGDDEWNAIMSASNHSYLYIISHFEHADNSIPLSLFYKFVMAFRPLDEIAINILPLATGIAMLVIFPRISGRLFGKQAAAVFGLLLALSPFLVYYSRFARPYIMVAFLGFVGIVWFYEWTQTKDMGKLILYIAAAVIASYFSPVAAPSLLAPLVFGAACAVLKRTDQFGTTELPSIGLAEIAVTAAAVVGGIMAWFLPAAPSLGVLAEKAGRQDMLFSTALDSLKVLSGYQSLGASVAALAFSVLGGLWLYRHNRTFLFLFLSAGAAQLLALVTVRPLGLQDELVFSRYLIAALPFYLLLIALGLTNVLLPRFKLIGSDQTKVVLIYLLLIATSLSSSPLLRAYASTNSFTNSSDFQRPAFSGWDHSESAPSLISAFYRDLASDKKVRTIIEYPYFFWWPGNLAHYYQQVHQRRVKIGCWPPLYFMPNLPLHNVQFRNFVALDSERAIADSGASYLVVHKDMAREVTYVEHIWKNGVKPAGEVLDDPETEAQHRYGPTARKSAAQTVSAMSQRFGAPFFEDEWITVFRLK